MNIAGNYFLLNSDMMVDENNIHELKYNFYVDEVLGFFSFDYYVMDVQRQNKPFFRK
jgi:hypothetical protein